MMGGCLIGSQAPEGMTMIGGENLCQAMMAHGWPAGGLHEPHVPYRPPSKAGATGHCGR